MHYCKNLFLKILFLNAMIILCARKRHAQILFRKTTYLNDILAEEKKLQFDRKFIKLYYLNNSKQKIKFKKIFKKTNLQSVYSQYNRNISI